MTRFTLLLAVGMVGCSAVDRQAQPALIGANADLQAVLPKLIDRMGSELDFTVDATFASSGVLKHQSESGAPFDLLIVASKEFLVHPNGFLRTRRLATGELALYGRNLPRSLEELPTTVGRILVPNPKLAPYGRAAMELLKAQPWFSRVEPRIVFCENVAETRAAADRNAAPFAIISRTQALAGKLPHLTLGAAAGVDIIGGAITERGAEMLDWISKPDQVQAFREAGLTPSDGQR